MKDAEVIDRVKKGDDSAAEFLYEKHYRMMVRLIMKNSGTENDAKDVYQDAIIVFWEKVTNGNFVLTSKISTYLYGVCHNLWRKELERRRRLSSEEVDSPTHMDVTKDERISAIHNCIGKLSETCQKVLKHYYFDGMSMNDIAEKLEFSNADTAKTKKYKCKKELDKMVLAMYTATDFLD